MRRDMDLIRALLLRFEKLHQTIGTILFELDDKDLQFEDYDPLVVAAHIRLMAEGRLIDAKVTGQGATMLNGITWAGHDFLDSVRDDRIWAKTKEGLHEAGGFTLDLAKALAKGLLKKQLENLTGVSIDI
ncbi:DUF2513 domain-containing protein [Agrobacterium tumefaciens]|uniref:DUF2513 domain-containing protein n=1 Tax=Agrobacterium tumefaciens TaxID=358 RepID=UPI0021D0A9C7|nr:DUF2513 domain-containing protein [Agrobacterium tumefaciens]UXS49262.1 DUF2513 domain-containing protein [Agrobacterium tumefaciens]